MKVFSILLLFALMQFTVFGQHNATELTQDLNEILTQFSADNAAQLTLHEKTGTLEEALTARSVLRIRVNDLIAIKAQAAEGHYSVTLQGADSSRCINILNGDMMATPMPSTAFFFTDARAANRFAQDLAELAKKFPTEYKHPEAELIGGTSASAALPAPKTNTSATGKTSSKKAENPLAIKTYDKELQDDETTEDKESKAEERKARLDEQKEARKTSLEANKERAEERKKEREEARQEKHDAIATQKEERAAQTAATKEEGQENVSDETICKQLMNIIEAGKSSQFKSIEGKQTNTDLKINDSKVHLKGAKRNYLSWYKNKRAFIAEFKTLTDHELILMEFEKLQTQLEDCFGPEWEDSDHSSDDMYANVQEEVKDVEYHSNTDAAKPTMRMLINHDKNGDKYTLYIRVQ